MPDEHEGISDALPERMEDDGGEEREDEKLSNANLERRDFVAKTAALAGAAGVVGVSGLARSAAAAESDANCGPNPRVMTVTFDFHSTNTRGRPDFREMTNQISQSGGELVSQLSRRFTDDNGWGDWLRDASGDSETMDMRRVSFKHVPFRTGGGGGRR